MMHDSQQRVLKFLQQRPACHTPNKDTLQSRDMFTHAPKLPREHFKFLSTFCLDGFFQDCCISTGAEIGRCSHRPLLLQDLRDATQIVVCWVNT